MHRLRKLHNIDWSLVLLGIDSSIKKWHILYLAGKKIFVNLPRSYSFHQFASFIIEAIQHDSTVRPSLHILMNPAPWYLAVLTFECSECFWIFIRWCSYVLQSAPRDFWVSIQVYWIIMYMLILCTFKVILMPRLLGYSTVGPFISKKSSFKEINIRVISISKVFEYFA